MADDQNINPSTIAMPPKEADLWRAQRVLAESALDFAISFLGCRMSSGKTPLDVTARSRLLDICRAVSFVETRHGTTGLNQPARDPFQCGNPADKWWRELTGQSGDGSRFVRGGADQPNLWANQVASYAEIWPGFDANAKTSLLAGPLKGHQNAAFGPAHSFFWGIIYLIHRINTTAGDPSYACGDLGRDRLIDGAAEYNGSGTADYKQRIVKALKEFGGLKASLVMPAEDMEPVAEPELLPAPAPEPVPLPSRPISGRAAITALIVGIALSILFGWHRIGPVAYSERFTEEVPRIATSLTVIAIFMERALAAINVAWLGTESEQARARVRAALLASGGSPVPLSATAAVQLHSAYMTAAAVEAKRGNLRAVLGFLFGLVISGAGVRTLGRLIDHGGTDIVQPGTIHFLNAVDIVLTAGLLAGGSSGMAKVAELLAAAVEGTTERLRANAAARTGLTR